MLDAARAGLDHWMVVCMVGLSALGALAAAIAAALARHLPTALVCACFSGLSLGVGLAASGFVAAGLLTIIVTGGAIALTGAAFLGLTESAARARQPVQTIGVVVATLVTGAFGLSGIISLLRDEKGHWPEDAITAAERIFVSAGPDFAPAIAGLCGVIVLMAGALAVHVRLGRDSRSFGTEASGIAAGHDVPPGNDRGAESRSGFRPESRFEPRAESGRGGDGPRP